MRSVAERVGIDTPQTTRFGAYGRRLTGLDGAASLLVRAPEPWPELAVSESRLERPGPEADVVGSADARLPLAGGGWMHVEREPARVTFHLDAELPAGDLVHPYLAPAAALLARWSGRESFHAGALLLDGGAWGVLGGKEAGKSTALAWLALNGHAVLSDDLVVLDGPQAMAGPRCLDLREASARRLGAGEPLGVIGVRPRWRVRLDPAPAEVPLRGWIVLAWDERTAVAPIRGSERLLALLPHRSVQLVPPDAATPMALSSLPVWRFSRPRSWDELPRSMERLLDALAG